MPNSRRRSTSALVPVAALALLAGGFLLVRPDRLPETTRAPTDLQSAAPATEPTPSPTSSPRPSTVVQPSAAARTAGRRFLVDYLRLIHGRESASAVRDAAPELRRELRRHPARPTPAQRARPPRIRRLNVTLASPGGGRAIATIQDGGPPYRLLLYLERRRTRWLVTRIGDV
jgi:hypothetical protein